MKFRASALIIVLGALVLSGCSPISDLGAPATSAPPSSAPQTIPRTSTTLDGAQDPDEGAQEAAPATTSTLSPSPQDGTESPTTAPDLVGELTFTIKNTLPHDPSVFTQGLAYHEGRLVESGGIYGQSHVRWYLPGSDEPDLLVDLGEEDFASGLDVLDDQIIQLTWQEETAYLRDIQTLEVAGELGYGGEGWGVCFDGEQVITSNGSDILMSRDPATFETLSTVAVTQDGVPLSQLNELECVGGYVWANIWLSSTIVRIDPATGMVVASVDLSSLVPAGVQADDVLNGIAYAPELDSYFVTGKRWDVLYELAIHP